MGAHHITAEAAGSRTTRHPALRTAATTSMAATTAVVAMAGIGAGVASAAPAHQGASSRAAAACEDSSSNDLSVAGIDLPGFDGMCDSTSDYSDGDHGIGHRSHRQPADAVTSGVLGGPDRSDRADSRQDEEPDAGTSVQPAAQSQPVQSQQTPGQQVQGQQVQGQQAPSQNSVDTPPPPGQTRIVKLPTVPTR